MPQRFFRVWTHDRVGSPLSPLERSVTTTACTNRRARARDREIRSGRILTLSFFPSVEARARAAPHPQSPRPRAPQAHTHIAPAPATPNHTPLQPTSMKLFAAGTLALAALLGSAAAADTSALRGSEVKCTHAFLLGMRGCVGVLALNVWVGAGGWAGGVLVWREGGCGGGGPAGRVRMARGPTVGANALGETNANASFSGSAPRPNPWGAGKHHPTEPWLSPLSPHPVLPTHDRGASSRRPRPCPPRPTRPTSSGTTATTGATSATGTAAWRR